MGFSFSENEFFKKAGVYYGKKELVEDVRPMKYKICNRWNKSFLNVACSIGLQVVIMPNMP